MYSLYCKSDVCSSSTRRRPDEICSARFAADLEQTSTISRMEPPANPFVVASQQWDVLVAKIIELTAKCTSLDNEILEKTKEHKKSCEDCKRQRADDLRREQDMEAALQEKIQSMETELKEQIERMQAALNEKLKEIRTEHELSITAMRDDHSRHADFHSHSTQSADDVTKCVAKRDKLNKEIVRLQGKQAEFLSLAPGEDLLPEIAPSVDDSTFCRTTEDGEEESATLRQIPSNHDPGFNDHQRARSEESISRGASDAHVRLKSCSPYWASAPPVDSRSMNKNGAVSVPAEDFYLPGKKYPVIRWYDDTDQWWHIRCRLCGANADSTGFFGDMHELRHHVNAKHTPVGGMTLRQGWCEAREASADDVEKIKKGEVAVDFRIKAFTGRDVDSATVDRLMKPPYQSHACNVSASSPSRAPLPAPPSSPPPRNAAPNKRVPSSAMAPPGTGFKPPPAQQPAALRRRPASAEGFRDDDHPPVRNEPAAQPDGGKRSRKKPQQSGLHYSITKSGSSAGPSSIEPNVVDSQASRAPEKTGALRRHKTFQEGQLRERNKARIIETVRQQDLDKSFGVVTTPANLAHDPPPQRALRDRQDFVYPR